jgi:hypothetical protein
MLEWSCFACVMNFVGDFIISDEQTIEKLAVKFSRTE